MFLYLILILHILLTKILKTISMYTQSFDKGYTEISDELKDEIVVYESKTGRIGFPVIININTDTISTDQDHSINLKLPYKSGDLGTDIMELLYVKKEGELFSIKNYNFTYFLNEENVIHTIYPNMFPDDIEDTEQNDIDCNYTILNNTYKLEYKTFQKMKNIIFYSYVILGLEKDSNTIKRIGYRDSSLYEFDIRGRVFKGIEYFNNSENTIFLDLFKIEQLFSKKGYIAFLVRHKTKTNQWNYLLLFYEIFLISEGFSLDIVKVINIKDIYKYNQTNSINDLDNLIKIEKVGYFENYIFILFKNEIKNNDLILLDSKTDEIINIVGEILNTEENMNITDFIVIKNVICLLIENKGLVLYRMSYDENERKIKFHFNTNFVFKYGKKIEIYKNPFYGVVFIGVLFNNDENKKGNEIFMELFTFIL